MREYDLEQESEGGGETNLFGGSSSSSLFFLSFPFALKLFSFRDINENTTRRNMITPHIG